MLVSVPVGVLAAAAVGVFVAVVVVAVVGGCVAVGDPSASPAVGET
jgi:hypothetical protein